MLNKLIFLLTILSYLLISCTNNTGNKKPSNGGSKPSSPLDCFKYSNSTNTITLKLVHIGESITGTLAYEMPERNTAKGTIQGHMERDLLIATFTPFVDSTTPRQIAFKLVGNYFIEGVGETYEENGKISFKSRNELQFIDGIKLIEFDCE